jgi:hypothetical protein
MAFSGCHWSSGWESTHGALSVGIDLEVEFGKRKELDVWPDSCGSCVGSAFGGVHEYHDKYATPPSDLLLVSSVLTFHGYRWDHLRFQLPLRKISYRGPCAKVASSVGADASSAAEAELGR